MLYCLTVICVEVIGHFWVMGFGRVEGQTIEEVSGEKMGKSQENSVIVPTTAFSERIFADLDVDCL